ncbi:MAG: hypothetical protein MI924_28030 [Chloroflexales bacterium]|nr:hypothetical protein [Chloroflexales bacterium]
MQVEELQQWLQSKLPATLTAMPPRIKIYSDEVVIVLYPNEAPMPDDSIDQRSAEQALIAYQRELTRSLRMRLADEIQKKLRLPVAWGMRIGESEVLFTTRTIPVMTRLGRIERDVLDTLVAAGVAETRSSALAYTVRAFAAEHADWLAEVSQVIEQVRQVRSRLKVARRQGVPIIPPPAPSDDDRTE